MVLPWYFVSSGLGSKLSMWLTPPTMNSQMTALALGLKCGTPPGRGLAESARATPSRWSNAARASPVKPMPVSARKLRRLTPGQQDKLALAMSSILGAAVAEFFEFFKFEQA